MKSLIISIVMITSLLIGGSALANKKEVICPCGCNQKAMVCGCPVAQETLKSLKET